MLLLMLTDEYFFDSMSRRSEASLSILRDLFFQGETHYANSRLCRIYFMAQNQYDKLSKDAVSRCAYLINAPGTNWAASGAAVESSESLVLTSAQRKHTTVSEQLPPFFKALPLREPFWWWLSRRCSFTHRLSLSGGHPEHSLVFSISIIFSLQVIHCLLNQHQDACHWQQPHYFSKTPTKHLKHSTQWFSQHCFWNNSLFCINEGYYKNANNNNSQDRED